ncbi:MAG: DUF2851 family protein, partial [Bacteroidetes bacterium]|nr:DUF2851 family protein [Fibrella sp.]
MPETLLYFLWQFQYFDLAGLATSGGESVQVLHPGFRNDDSGPDFANARLIINDVEWAGTVEIHTKTSDWLAHRHQRDRAYDNVILHVVWEDDRTGIGRQLTRTDGTPIPTLELQHRTDHTLLSRYEALAVSGGSIACAGQFRAVQPLKLTSMLDKAMLQRLERKAADVKALFLAANQDWEETTYRLLARNFGFKVNADPMEQLARAVPLKALLKHRDALVQVEAMLFGTAGLLAETGETDEYLETLRREYRFLAVKYNLAASELSAHGWKWGRLRPANFPTLRLAQFARLVATSGSLFSLLIEADDALLLGKALQVVPSAYWQTHYRFGKATEKGAPALGQTSAATIVVNTVVPLLAAYAHHREEPAYIDRAIALLEQLPAEHIRITAGWADLGLSVRTAFDSQASIELFNEFCTPKKCLSCQIGLALV